MLSQTEPRYPVDVYIPPLTMYCSKMISLQSLFGGDADVLRDKNFQLLLLISFLVPFGTAIMSPILDTLIDPFGASPATIGLIISVFVLPSIALIPVTGILADRFGRKPILAPALVLYGVPGALIALTTEFEIVLGLRFVQGIGWAGLTALIVTSIGDLYTGSTEATAQGLRQTGVGLMSGIISLVAGLLVVIAWQFPFFLYLLTIPVAITVYLWFDEPTKTQPSMATVGNNETTYPRELFSLVRRIRVLAIVMARPLPIVPWFGFITYNSLVVVRIHDGTATQAGILFGLASVVYAMSASQTGRLTAIFSDRYRLLIIANVLMTLGTIFIFLAPVLPVAVAGVVIIGIGFGVSVPLYRTLLTGFAPGHLRAGLVSLASTGGRLLAVLTPIAMGVLIAVLTPRLGFAGAVQIAGLGAALVGGGGGIMLVLVAMVSPPVAVE